MTATYTKINVFYSKSEKKWHAHMLVGSTPIKWVSGTSYEDVAAKLTTHFIVEWSKDSASDLDGKDCTVRELAAKARAAADDSEIGALLHDTYGATLTADHIERAFDLAFAVVIDEYHRRRQAHIIGDAYNAIQERPSDAAAALMALIDVLDLHDRIF